MQEEAKPGDASTTLRTPSPRRRRGGGGAILSPPAGTTVSASRQDAPPRKLKSAPVAAPGTLDVHAAWTGVLHPYVEEAIAPALRLLRTRGGGGVGVGPGGAAGGSGHGSAGEDGSAGGDGEDGSEGGEGEGAGEAVGSEVTFKQFVAAVRRSVDKARPPMRLYFLTKVRRGGGAEGAGGQAGGVRAGGGREGRGLGTGGLGGGGGSGDKGQGRMAICARGDCGPALP